MKAKIRGRPQGEPPAKLPLHQGARTSERQLLTATKAAAGLGLALKMPLDAYATEEICNGLDEIAAARDAVPLTREILLSALRIISEALKPVTHTVIDRLDTGQFVVVNHPVIERLDEFIDALSDLDRGKTHRVLKAASHQANRALTTEQQKRDQTLLRACRRAGRARPAQGNCRRRRVGYTSRRRWLQRRKLCQESGPEHR